MEEVQNINFWGRGREEGRKRAILVRARDQSLKGWNAYAV